MKKIVYVFFAALTFYSCYKEEPPVVSTCLQLKQNPDWELKDFKPYLTIQLPDDYKGGLYGAEGPLFHAYNTMRTVEFQYAYCSPLWCVAYGDTLTNPEIDTITIQDYYYDNVILDHRKEFCDDLVTLGIFYYGHADPMVGTFYWYTDHFFREALTVYYDSLFQSEVEQILGTIKRK
jgi:hypothetical protein